MRTHLFAAALLGLALGLGLGCNGPEADDESEAWDPSWAVGPVFAGFYGLTIGELESVQYFVLHDDGSVEWGVTFSCGPSEPAPFGSWSQTGEDEIEIRTSAESWPGTPNLEFIRLQRTAECRTLQASEVEFAGSLTTKGVHSYSRGVACLSDCDGSGERAIVECPAAVDPCD